MRRLAIFVEGYTELIFVDRLIREVAEISNISIQHRQIRGGGKKSGVRKRYIELTAPTSSDGKSLYFLIVDCGGEHLVSQRVLEEHENLTRVGYERILGLRDVYPNFTRADIPKLRRGLLYGVKTSLIPVQFILTVMELEAWFLAEHNHFKAIDLGLTPEFIQSRLGFDPAQDDMTCRSTPAIDLTNAYGLVGKPYVKGNASSTVESLDFAHIYTEMRMKIAELAELIDAIDLFISPPSGPQYLES